MLKREEMSKKDLAKVSKEVDKMMECAAFLDSRAETLFASTYDKKEAIEMHDLAMKLKSVAEDLLK